MRRHFIALVLLLLAGANLHAQTGEEIRNHIIIAIDEWVGGFSPADDDIRDMVEKYLYEPVIYTEAKINAKGRKVIDTTYVYGKQSLYKEGDFLSILTCSLGQAAETIDSYADFPIFKGSPYKFMPYSKENKKTLHNNWDELVSRRVSEDKRHSIFSIAVPQVMSKCIRQEDFHLTNRTFVIVITDRSYSDKSYFDDIRDYTDQQYSVLHTHAVKKSDIVRAGEQVARDYFIQWINQDEPTYKFVRNGSVLRKKNVDLYELQPHQEHLRMPAVLQYPAQVFAKRGKWGQYTIDCTFMPEDKSRFNVLHLEASLNGSKQSPGERSVLSYKAQSPNEIFAGKRITCNLGKKSNAFDSMEVRAWVNLLDGIYNATVLTPSKDAASFMGRDGLNVQIPIVYEEKEKVAFVFPLLDVFCWTGDQKVDAVLIDLLLIIIIIAALFIWVYRTREYKPSVDEIKITYRNRE